MATSLPAAADFTGAAVTEGDFKAAITDLRAYLNELFGANGETATALGTLGALLSGSLSKAGAYTVVAADRGKAIVCTGTWTLSLTAAATLADGFTFAVVNAGTGTITVDPNLTEQIDGATTLILAAGKSAVVCCNGSGFYSIGAKASGGLISVTAYTANGTHTTSSTCQKLVALAVGGGGAGGGEIGSTTNGAEGGQAGAVAWAYTSSPSASYAITIGAGGTGTSGAGNTGSSTSVGALLTAAGGLGGYSANTVAAFTNHASAGESGYGIGGAGRTSTGAGNAAAANSGAGGGGAKGNGSTPVNGGSGGSGLVLIWEFA